jgi:hypothetical protein
LGWVYENADHGDFVFRAASFDERRMPAVKRSHGGDKADGLRENGAAMAGPFGHGIPEFHL